MARVLIVDEDALLRDFLKSCLSRDGHSVTAVKSPREVEAGEYDAVISEIERPFSLDRFQQRLRMMGLTRAA